MKQTVVFDFDGVIHSYTSGWQGADVIPDPPVKGIRGALADIHDAGYEVVVVSTRCATEEGRKAIEKWLHDNILDRHIDRICAEKPPAIVYIDDRAICFDGKPETLLEKIESFKPWYKSDRKQATSDSSQATSEWIPCSERLPDRNGTYLITVSSYDETASIEYITVDHGNSDGGFLHFETKKNPKAKSGKVVTAWMPAPEPYQKGENDVINKRK